MRVLRRLVTASLMAGCLLAGLPNAHHARAENAAASLMAELSLRDPATGEIAPARAGVPVLLSLALRDGVTGRPPRGLDLFAWVRRREAGNSSCTEAARAFRSTRRIPADAVDLNGILIVTLNRDASIGVVDPKLNLFTSNMIAAHKLERMPSAMAVDRVGMRALVLHAGQSELIELKLANGQASTLDTPVKAPVSVAAGPDGAIWLGDELGKLHRLSPDGALMHSYEVGPGPVTILPRVDPEDLRIGAFSSGGGVLLVNGTTGAEILRATLGTPITDATFIGEDAALVMPTGQSRAEIRYADAPDRAIRVPVALPFARIASGPDRRVAVAYTPGESIVALIDVARARVVQSLALNDATVSEVGFTDNAAYLLSHDGGFVGAIDTATVALGRDATMRHVNLGARSRLPPQGARLLAPLFPAPMMLAVEPENQTGWVIGELASSVEMPPMDSTRLRGGVPHQARVVDRSLREVAPGRYETTWLFPAGPHEMVVTTGIAGLSTCIPFDVAGDVRSARAIPVRIRAGVASGAAIAGRDVTLRISLTTTAGAAVTGIEELPLLVPSLISGWRTQVAARRTEDGMFEATVRFPHAGPFAIQPLALPENHRLASAFVLDVTEDKD